VRATVTAALALVAATACGSDPAIVVEVRGRPALGEVKQLEITVANAGSTETQSFDVEGESFPATFSITTNGRAGAIEISARGLADDVVTAVGATTVDAAASDGVLLLDPADFVVNTEFAGDQAPNVDIETNGFQITANGGVVTLGFGDDCPVSVCNQYGRRFTVDGRPQSTALGAGTNQFRWNQADGQFAATLAVASQPDGGSIALWDTPTGVSCRAMDPGGNPAGAELQIAADAGADVVSAVPLANGSYSVAWVADDAATTNRVIRSAVVSTTCGTVIPAFIAAGSISFASRPAIAHGPSGTMIAWIENFDAARFRIGAVTGSFSPVGAAQTGTVLISPPGTDTIEFIRPIVSDDGFAIAYHASDFDLTNDRVLLRRASPAGAQIGTDTLIAEHVAYASPAIARRVVDGALAVAWAQCDAGGDGAGCGVLVQLVRPSGLPVGPPYHVNTTTVGDQDRPSIAPTTDGFVVTFADVSMSTPDVDLGATRARFIYPPYDDARRVIGARCSTTADCGSPDLVCGTDSTDDLLCAPACSGTGTGPCPIGGTCTTANGESYCRF
jgi:hypothetical protein